MSQKSSRHRARWPRRSGTSTSSASAEGEPDLLFIDLHLVHEVTSPQAFDGLRQAGRVVRRPDLTLATEDHNIPTIDVDKPIADPVSRAQVEALRDELRGVRHPAALARRRRAGHRARGRPAARTHPAGHDGRLRRLAHLDARRVRRARVRHRHQRGRARPRHPDAAAGPPEDDGGQRRGAASRRRHRQGPGARADRAGGHRRRTGLHRRVPRRGDRGAVDGSPDDDLQHEHRVGRQGRHDRARRDHARLPRGSAARTEGRGVGRRRRLLVVARRPTTARCSTRRSTSTPAALSPFVTWGTNPGQGVPLGGAVPDPDRLRRRRPTASLPSGRWTTWR